jgi:hypothetical protein
MNMEHRDINSSDKKADVKTSFTYRKCNIPAFKHEPHNICDGRMMPIEASEAPQPEKSIRHAFIATLITNP